MSILYRSSISSQSGQKLWYKNLSGKRGKLISAAQRGRFDATQIVCVEYDTITDHEEREIFQVALYLSQYDFKLFITANSEFKWVLLYLQQVCGQIYLLLFIHLTFHFGRTFKGD